MVVLQKRLRRNCQRVETGPKGTWLLFIASSAPRRDATRQNRSERHKYAQRKASFIHYKGEYCLYRIAAYLSKLSLITKHAA